MQKHLSPQKIFFLYNALLAIGAGVVFITTLMASSEPSNTILFGLSKMRLVLALSILIIFVFFSLLTVKSATNTIWTEKALETWFGSGKFSKLTGWLGGINFGVGWIGSFISAERTGIFEDYLINLRLVMLLVLFTGFITLATLYINREKFSVSFKVFQKSIIPFLVCTFALSLMIYSKLGVSSREDFWYGAGVPILALQLVGVIISSVLFFQIEKTKGSRFDWIVFFLLFVLTAFLWFREPLQKSFLFVGPYPPNQVLYPFADATNFDVGSQFALIGQKIFAYKTYFFERPLYLSFLVYLHTFFGQDYQLLMAVQAGIFSIFPALIYLIGKSLNIRPVGFAAALIAMFRGINSIAGSNLMDMANPKMILTDFPAAIGVALIVLVTCEWLKTPNKNHHALWLGGALGFTLMLRTNALILLFLIPVYAFLKFIPKWKKWLFQSFLVLVAVVAITLPWEVRNLSLGGRMYGPIIDKFKAVIDTRYTPSLTAPAGFTQPSPLIQSTYILEWLYQTHPEQLTSECSSVGCFVLNHFLHNILTSVLIFPTSPIMDNLRHIVANNPYWNPLWDGTFALSGLFFLILNLFVIILGISLAWDRGRLRGMAPLAIFMFYNLSNALARTSGGRYIVPMDWIITIYFLLGVFQIILLFANSLGIDWKFATDQSVHVEATSPRLSVVGQSVLTILILMGFGTLIPLSETLHPERYKSFNTDLLLAQNEQALKLAGLDIQSIKSFEQNQDAEILVGRALYPRYYGANRGESLFYPTLKLPFPRITFTLIGPAGENGVILPGDIPAHLPHTSDILVIGCKGVDYFDALAVIVLDESDSVYVRQPLSILQCPLQQPVCDNNSVCN